MKIQSLSVVVPNNQCINHCASCPSRMHDNNYPDLISRRDGMFDIRLKEYLKRLEYARDNGCNALMLTGSSEPQQNKNFLTWFGMMQQMMEKPFRNIEMQCTGVLLDEDYIRFLHRHVGVTTLALSIFSMDWRRNRDIINPPANVSLDPMKVAKMAKEEGMSVRVCLNLTKSFDWYASNPAALFDDVKKDFDADQVTLRVLYAGTADTPEDNWVHEHQASERTVNNLWDYIVKNNGFLGILPYGASKYGVNGMSVVVDNDCMGKHSEEGTNLKYLILRPDCKLYSSWDDKGSLVF